MRMRDIKPGQDYAVRLTNIARAPRAGGSTIVKCRVGDVRSSTLHYVIPEMGMFSPCMVKSKQVLALWDDYVTERYESKRWSHAFDGISGHKGLDLGESLRAFDPDTDTWEIDNDALKAIADRIHSLSEQLVVASNDWGGEAADTGLPTITVRELPPHCPQGDLDCPYA
jgi:hypothetical protein